MIGAHDLARQRAGATRRLASGKTACAKSGERDSIAMISGRQALATKD
jgi:hypothetical protein